MSGVKRYDYGYKGDEWGGARYLGLIEKPDGKLVRYEDHDAIVSGLEGQLDQAGIANAVLRDDLAATEARLHEVAVACATVEQGRDHLAWQCKELEAKLKFYQDAIDSHIRLAAQRDALRAEVERLRKDAERYRFVRELAWYVDRAAYVYEVGNNRSPWAGERVQVDSDDIEVAIDAALEASR